MISFTVVTLFPDIFGSPLRHGILKRAQEKGLLSVRPVNLRDYAEDKHKTTDDYPYGGGQGMILKVEPVVAALEDIAKKADRPRVILLSPRGRRFDQAEAARLAQEREVVLICGRYEGVDERVRSFIDDELSVGDFMLSGGEIAALVVIDAVARLIPGALGNPKSSAEESFADGLLEFPQYTRPKLFRGDQVPEVLLSGDHQRIAEWRRTMSLKITGERRPDLVEKANLSSEERKVAAATDAAVYLSLLHYPVYNKNRQVVTTAITNMDIHDIARSARTYGVRGFYIVTPVKTLQRLALKIMHHWEIGYGSTYNETRKEALSVVRLQEDLDTVVVDIERECGARPVLVATSARGGPGRASFAAMKAMLKRGPGPFLFLLGTGWGLTEAIMERSDCVLEPIAGGRDYNHLSVRSATAILLDRLFG
jgi:tRNA (guanine37-N1)-methyltransferase